MDFVRRILVPVTVIATLGFSTAAFASSRAGSPASDGTGQSSAITKNPHSVTQAVADRPASRTRSGASTATRHNASTTRNPARSSFSAASSRSARAR